MTFRFPRFLGAPAAGDPPNLTATLVAARQAQERKELRSFSLEPAAEAFRRAIPSPAGANKVDSEAHQSSGAGTSPASCLRAAAFCALLVTRTD